MLNYVEITDRSVVDCYTNKLILQKYSEIIITKSKQGLETRLGSTRYKKITNFC